MQAPARPGASQQAGKVIGLTISSSIGLVLGLYFMGYLLGMGWHGIRSFYNHL